MYKKWKEALTQRVFSKYGLHFMVSEFMELIKSQNTKTPEQDSNHVDFKSYPKSSEMIFVLMDIYSKHNINFGHIPLNELYYCINAAMAFDKTKEELQPVLAEFIYQTTNGDALPNWLTAEMILKDFFEHFKEEELDELKKESKRLNEKFLERIYLAF